MNLKVDLAGVTLNNPIMTASGTFGSGVHGIICQKFHFVHSQFTQNLGSYSIDRKSVV